jgi:nicotinamide-nucleotide amidase
MIAEIICIGDELLTGATVNSNAAFIGEQLTRAGIDVGWVTAVGDRADRMIETLEKAVMRARLLFITGGLGPTHDDITKTVIADFFRRSLIFHADIYEKLEKFFQARKWPVPSSNRIQAEIPEGAVILDNPLGTAPGFYIHDKIKNRSVHCFVMPGVPSEMQKMLTENVLPVLKKARFNRLFLSKTIHTIGIGESVLNQKLRGFRKQFPRIRLASLPNPQGVSLRISLYSVKEPRASASFEEAILFIRRIAGRFVYGEDEETLESVVGGLLTRKKLKISVAESCTGGLISHRLTNIPGSSAYFVQGLVTYSNLSKIDLLFVPKSTIEKYGAVSAETAMAMAEGVRRRSRADVGLAVTGIAGPDGGTNDKPVGLTFIGYADESQSLTERYHFGKDRLLNKMRSAGYAVDLVRRILQDST